MHVTDHIEIYYLRSNISPKLVIAKMRYDTTANTVRYGRPFLLIMANLSAPYSTRAK